MLRAAVLTKALSKGGGVGARRRSRDGGDPLAAIVDGQIHHGRGRFSRGRSAGGVAAMARHARDARAHAAQGRTKAGKGAQREHSYAKNTESTAMRRT